MKSWERISCRYRNNYTRQRFIFFRLTHPSVAPWNFLAACSRLCAINGLLIGCTGRSTSLTPVYYSLKCLISLQSPGTNEGPEVRSRLPLLRLRGQQKHLVQSYWANLAWYAITYYPKNGLNCCVPNQMVVFVAFPRRTPTSLENSERPRETRIM